MFTAIYEFLFCPQHGLFAPANLAFILPTLSAAGMYVRRIWSKL